MRGAWGSLVTLGAVGVMLVIAGLMLNDYLDSHGTIIGSPGGEYNVAMATVGRMRSLIGQLQIR